MLTFFKPSEALCVVITGIKSFLLIGQKPFINWLSFDACHHQRQKKLMVDLHADVFKPTEALCVVITGIKSFLLIAHKPYIN